MQNTATFGKRAFTMAIVFATILWSVGVSFFMMPSTSHAATSLTNGELIKGSLSTVYYYWDGERYTFPNEKTFMTWFANFDDVMTISDSALADVPLAGNAVYRPGTYMIKIDSDPKVYIVDRSGAIHWVESETVATDIFGSDWNKWIQDVPDVFFTDYTEGASAMTAKLYDGMLVKNGSYTDLVWDGKLRELSSAGMSDNRLWSKFVLTDTSVSLTGYAAGDDITGEISGISDASQTATTTTTTAATGMLTVSLASDSPASATVVAGQALADLAHLSFANGSSSDVKVTTLKLKRTGVSSDTTLSAVYLFSGATRLTDSASVSSGVITFTDTAGLFTVGANSTGSINILSNIAASTSGQTIGVEVLAATSVSTNQSGVTVDGSFPVAGSTFTVATVTDFATVAFAISTTPAAATVAAQNDLTVWQNTVSINNTKSYLNSVRFRQIGSISSGDINNFRFYVDGTMYGSAMSALDTNGYVTFDFSASPITLQTGSRVFKLLADVIGGTTRTVQMSLRSTADVNVEDSNYEQSILVTGNATTTTGAYAAHDAGIQTIDSGTLTVTKTSDSASGNVTNASSGQSLAKFTLVAAGEKMKVESMRFSATASVVTASAFTLRNGAIYANGVQIGSTAALAGDTDATLAYTEYTFGSSLIVVPGTPVTLEIRADMYDSDGTQDVAAATTIRGNVTAGSSNVLRMTSNSYASIPASTTNGNTLTVAVGTLTVARDTSLASQTSVAPKSAYKFGAYTITNTTTEAVNLNTLTFDETVTANGTTASTSTTPTLATMLAAQTNIYAKYGTSTSALTTSSTKATISAATSNSWSINYSLAAGATMYVYLYGDFASTITDGAGGVESILAALTVAGTGATSGSTAAGTLNANGHTVTWGSGSFTSTLDGSSGTNKIVAGNQETEVAKFRFTATSETYTIKELRVSVASTTVATAVASVRAYDGTTLLGSAPIGSYSTTAALITGLSTTVTSNSYKTLTIKLVLNDVGTGLGTSGVNAVTTLANTLIADSQGVQSNNTPTVGAGNEVYVFKTVPTVTLGTLTSASVSNGQAQDLYKFTVSASSSGSLAIKQFTLPVTWSDGATGDTLTVGSWKLMKDGTDISSNSSTATVQTQGGTNIESGSSLAESDTAVIVTFGTEDVVTAGGSVTYTLRGTPAGFRVTGTTDSVNTDYVSFYLSGDAAQNSTSNFLNDGTSATSVVKLFTSAAAGSASALCPLISIGNCPGSGTTARLIWSDNNSSSHVTTTGTTSSGDWFNGYNVLSLDLSSYAWGR